MRNSLLEPERFGVNGDGGIGDGGNIFGAAEDVNDINGDRNIFEASVRFFAENFGLIWIHGDDFVADGLEIGGNFV